MVKKGYWLYFTCDTNTKPGSHVQKQQYMNKFRGEEMKKKN